MKYTVSLTTKLKPPQAGVIAIEPEDYTAAEIEALKENGTTVLGYLSVGSVSDERSYYGQLESYTLRKLDDWPHERYLDLRHPEVRDWLQNQALAFKKMGFDGYWIDNLDVYEEYRDTEMFKGILAVLHGIKAIGGYVMINGGSVFLMDMLAPNKVQLGAYREEKNALKVKAALKKAGFKSEIIEMDNLYKVQAGAFSLRSGADQKVEALHNAGLYSAKCIMLFDGKIRAYLDGVTQEEVFSLITDYSGKGKFGKQKQDESERYQTIIRKLIKAGVEVYLLEYTRDNTLKLRIRAFCATTGAVACISDDVNL